MKYIVSAMLIIAGVIHLLPLIGVLGSDQLQRLYGLAISDLNLSILMRHRAVLFGLLGGLMMFAAIREDLQIIAIVAGLISSVSFALIAWSAGWGTAVINAAMLRVVTADWIAIACLIVALVVRLWFVSSGSK